MGGDHQWMPTCVGMCGQCPKCEHAIWESGGERSNATDVEALERYVVHANRFVLSLKSKAPLSAEAMAAPLLYHAKTDLDEHEYAAFAQLVGAGRKFALESCVALAVNLRKQSLVEAESAPPKHGRRWTEAIPCCVRCGRNDLSERPIWRSTSKGLCTTCRITVQRNGKRGSGPITDVPCEPSQTPSEATECIAGTTGSVGTSRGATNEAIAGGQR